MSVLSNYQQQQSFGKRRGYRLQLIIPSQGSGEAEKMRREVREDIPLCLRDKPEWAQFSGITCNDRRERAERTAGLTWKRERRSSGPTGGWGWWWEQLLGTATRLDSVISPTGERKRERTGEVGKEEGKTQMVYD